VSMDIGMSLLVYNFMRTAMAAAPQGRLAPVTAPGAVGGRP